MSVTQELGNRIIMASAQEVIDAPPSEVWPFLSAIGTERVLIPGCTKSVLIECQGKGALRRIYFGDVAFDERILECNPTSYKFKYEVIEPSASPARGVLGVVKLEPMGENQTTISWATGVKGIAPEAREAIIQQAQHLCHGQIASLKMLVQATTNSFQMVE
ncbi:Hypothetical protein NCS54_01495200 [Fusarium falciforme]|uniref:Hypothetical protein n=1 Tax=Fusarium falciforme TaxID=195108 RepID=UPI0023012C3F|nr:Hypothetical protein NCS54_01495200 [Fusarium falciforme]WAO97237.1 Hypothetical protein NCS54_01495200 [Fusarium falciforme]